MSRWHSRKGWEAYGSTTIGKYRRYCLALDRRWWVLHCGHPTALYPYYIVELEKPFEAFGDEQQGRMWLNPVTGRGFVHLVDAEQRAEGLAAMTAAELEAERERIGREHDAAVRAWQERKEARRKARKAGRY